MYLMGLSQYLNWRKGWDSNPRTGSSPITRFRVERVTASSLPFHKRVLYTKCRQRASLFSCAAMATFRRPACSPLPSRLRAAAEPFIQDRMAAASGRCPKQGMPFSLLIRQKKRPVGERRAFDMTLSSSGQSPGKCV